MISAPRHARSLRWLVFGGLWLVTATARAQDPASATAASSDPVVEAPSLNAAVRYLGLPPGTPQTASLILSEAKPVESTGAESSEWQFRFAGFLRAPMRLGFGSGKDADPSAGRGLKLHSPPQIPDGGYLDWRYTSVLPGPWAQLRFMYGNDRVTANVLISAYNLTDSGYRNLQAQLGIDQAFITLQAPDLFGTRGGVTWNVGAFQNAYGAPGRYDAGRYSTYLFGRTHVAGETLSAYLDLTPRIRLLAEHGFGVKLEIPPVVSGLPEPSPAYLPYPGPEQQGTTLVHHAHAGLSIDGKVTLAGHYITTWTQDARLKGEKDGRIDVYGAELKLVGGVWGEGFVGYSLTDSKTPLRVAESLELLHSQGGWNLRDNYFPGTDGSGQVHTVLAEYQYSIATLLRHPEPFWGQSPDIIVGVFGMSNWITPSDKAFKGPKHKSKFGGDVTYTMLSWLGAAVRYDLVQPNLQNNTYSFHELSPRLIFRTRFVTHEQVMVQYTRYWNGKNVAPAWPNASLRPDEDVLMVSAIMWW